MASTNSSVGITINIVCKEVQYDFSDFPDYDFIRQAAISAVQKEYAEHQREEDEEIEDMLNDGSLSSADDFDRAYGEPFDPNKCEQRIVEVTEMYCRNVADLPKRVVVEVDSRLSADENTLKKAIEDKFGVPVKSIKAHDIARESDIRCQMSYDAVTAMTQSDDYKLYLDLTSNLKRYSTSNIALIVSQRPDAEAVFGGLDWYRKGRTVPEDKKESSAIKIWGYCSKLLKSEQEIVAYLNKRDDKYGSPGSKKYESAKKKMLRELSQKGEAEADGYFTFVPVYDIKSTVSRTPENDNLQELLDAIRFNKPLNSTLDNCADVISCMEKAMGIPDGQIKLDGSLPEQESLYQTIEKYAEELFRTNPESILGIKSRMPSEGQIHDMETLISASLIAKHIGIECDDKAAYGLLGIMKDRLSQQSMEIGRREMFTTAYDRATALFKQFYKAFDKEFTALEKQRETEKAKAEVAASITDKVSDVPLITCEGAKAREAGIIEDWRKSKAENGAVIDAVRKSITANSTYLNHGQIVDTDKVVDDVLKQFPPERVALVFAREVYPNAARMRGGSHDGRIAESVAKWAKNLLKQQGSDFSYDIFPMYNISDASHPTIVNDVIKSFIESQPEKAQDKPQPKRKTNIERD